MSYRLLKVSELSAVPADYSLARSDLFQVTTGTNLVGVPLSSVKMQFQEFAAYLNSTTNTDAAWVSAGIDIYSANNGNVGVGNTDPPEKLSVSGSISAAGALSAVGPALHNHFSGRVGIGALAQKTLFEIASTGSLAQGTGMRVVDDSNSGSEYIGFDSTTNTETMAFYIRHYNTNSTLSGDVVIGNEAAIRFRDAGVGTGHTFILTGGDVGIGDDIVPTAKLHVKDNTGQAGVKVEDTGSDSIPYIQIKNDVRTWKIRVDGGDSVQADSFKVSDDGGNKFTIDTAGNVGIGVTNPATKLDVDGAVKIQDGNASTDYVTIEAPATFDSVGANPVIYKYNGTESFRFDISPPRFGIGTTKPNGEIHINSTGALIIPVGTRDQRPSSTNALGLTAQTGQIRYNTTTSQFEGFGAGDAWGSLGGIKDVDGDTYILAEDTPTTDNDELDFYIGVSDTAVKQITLSDGVLWPATDSDVDLGTSDYRWKDGWIDG